MGRKQPTPPPIGIEKPEPPSAPPPKVSGETNISDEIRLLVKDILDQIEARLTAGDEGVWLEHFDGYPVFIKLPLPDGSFLWRPGNEHNQVGLECIRGIGSLRLAGSLSEVAAKLGLPAPPEED